MRRLFFILFCLCCASGAIAQVAEIRSGDHSTFTRLIIDLPERTEWQISESNRRAVLSFANKQLTFDTSLVFQRIPRERVTDVTISDQGNIQIDVGCDCQFSTFWFGKSLLVLDVLEPQEDVPPTIEVASISEKVASRPSIKPTVDIPQNTGSLAAALTVSQFQQEPLLEIEPSVSSSQIEREGGSISEAQIDETRNKLVKQLGRAATQGLLSPRASLRTKSKKRKEGKSLVESEIREESDTQQRSTKKVLTHNINLQAQSSIDQDFLSQLSTRTDDLESIKCINTDLINVGNWGTDRPFSQQVGTLRVQLIGEFDKVNEEIAASLARLYLYFGFGAEARLALELIADSSEDLAMLKALAEIMEEGHAPSGATLSTQLNCETPAALWSVLSYKSLPADTAIDTDSVLRTFNALPIHLRTYLGPVLSRRFLEAGNDDVAQGIFRILNRNEHSVTPESKLIGAEINIVQGSEVQASDTLTEVAEANKEVSAQALVRLIETKLDAGQEISYEQAQLAGSYAQENRGNAIGQDLTRVYLMALAASGAFKKAYEEFERLSLDLTAEEKIVVRSELLVRLTQHADELTFLQNVFTHHRAMPSELDTRAANTAAERLLNIGFTQQARLILTKDSNGEGGRDRQILRAKISLLEGRPRQAEVELLNLSDGTANALRAEARSRVGEHKSAARLFASTNQFERSLNESWLAEDWNALAASQSEALADFAGLLALEVDSENSGSETGSERILARNRSLVEKSNMMRNTIEALLQTKPMPE